ncbi:MAG: transcriptional regulator [Desulfobacterium sp.]|nr:transcriptional regulator [Desulfobacterium sp.]
MHKDIKSNLGQNINGHILFVDDEENILEIAVEFFQHKGYSIITASNGVEALNLLSTEKIICCFTDINMPEMDGLQLAEEIRKIDNTIPVIVMTGYPSLENSIRTLKNGVVDFLIKPVNLNQMEVCVQRVLRERQLFIKNILLSKEVEGKERLEKLNKELVYKLEELQNLNKIMTDLSVINNTTDIFKLIVEITIELTKADESKFFVINESENLPFKVSSSFSDSYLQLLSQKQMEIPQKEGSRFQQVIIETVADEIPLLVSENKNTDASIADHLSFMIVPLKIQEKVFGVLTASIKTGNKRFTERELYYLSFMTQRAASAIENLALYEHINRGLMTTLKAFVKAIEARDPYTKEHSNRVTEIAIAIGKKIGCSDEEIDILKISGPLHDIGKIGIRDEILLKPGRLTEDEFKKIMEHPDIGADIIGQLGMWDEHQEIIRHHHERFDGTGYPSKLKKEEIPRLARIVSVADSYDAMASDRAYRKKMDPDKILAILSDCSGTQFDPEYVDAFLALFKEGKIN